MSIPSNPRIPSRKVENAAGDPIMPVLRDPQQLNRFCFHGLGRMDAARCARNWIILANVAAWLLIVLAARAILF
jgi:hypothetical protein